MTTVKSGNKYELANDDEDAELEKLIEIVREKQDEVKLTEQKLTKAEDDLKVAQANLDQANLTEDKDRQKSATEALKAAQANLAAAEAEAIAAAEAEAIAIANYTKAENAETAVKDTAITPNKILMDVYFILKHKVIYKLCY